MRKLPCKFSVLKTGFAAGVPSVHKHVCGLSNQHSVELVLREFQSSVMSMSDMMPKVFSEVLGEVYSREEVATRFVPFSPRPPILVCLLFELGVNITMRGQIQNVLVYTWFKE